MLDRPRLLLEGLADTRVAAGLLDPLEDLVRIGRARGEGIGPVDPEGVSRALWALFVGGLLLERLGEVDPADIRREGLPVLMALVRGFSVADAAGRS